MKIFAASEEWMGDAKCLTLSVTRGPLGEPSEVDAMFYPEDINANGRARRFCNGVDDREPCPVRAQCLALALANEDKYGVWGGMSHLQRARLPKPLAVAR